MPMPKEGGNASSGSDSVASSESMSQSSDSLKDDRKAHRRRNLKRAQTTFLKSSSKNVFGGQGQNQIMIDLGKDTNKRRGGILSIKINEGEELVKQTKNVRFAKDSV